MPSVVYSSSDYFVSSLEEEKRRMRKKRISLVWSGLVPAEFENTHEGGA